MSAPERFCRDDVDDVQAVAARAAHALAGLIGLAIALAGRGIEVAALRVLEELVAAATDRRARGGPRDAGPGRDPRRWAVARDIDGSLGADGRCDREQEHPDEG